MLSQKRIFFYPINNVTVLAMTILIKFKFWTVLLKALGFRSVNRGTIKMLPKNYNVFTYTPHYTISANCWTLWE